jgi:hypothetical protein
MTITPYGLCVPAYQRGLTVLARLLEKAEDHVARNGLDAGDMLQARLAPDMLNLVGQVQRASDTAKNSIRRLTGREVPAFEDVESTFPQLRERVARTLALFDTVNEADYAGSAERPIEMKFPGITLNLSGLEYLQQFALPNFYFHVTTAYDLLRHKGVSIGKLDYLGFAPQA